MWFWTKKKKKSGEWKSMFVPILHVWLTPSQKQQKTLSGLELEVSDWMHRCAQEQSLPGLLCWTQEGLGLAEPFGWPAMGLQDMLLSLQG